LIVAVIPLKRLAEAKSRLAPGLDPQDRARLAVSLAERAIAALRDSGAIDRVALATPEHGLSETLGVESVTDRGSLNASLAEGVRWAARIGASRLLILPADLAHLDAQDVRSLVHALPEGPGIAICPTVDGGTGALLLDPPDAIPPSFGEGSFQRHVNLARDRGFHPHVVERRGFSFDVDTIADLDAMEQVPGSRVISERS
jgi:2-phospho-L-lactate/phosphoenolpyruvate guanylyltransferase